MQMEAAALPMLVDNAAQFLQAQWTVRVFIWYISMMLHTMDEHQLLYIWFSDFSEQKENFLNALFLQVSKSNKLHWGIVVYADVARFCEATLLLIWSTFGIWNVCRHAASRDFTWSS